MTVCGIIDAMSIDLEYRSVYEENVFNKVMSIVMIVFLKDSHIQYCANLWKWNGTNLSLLPSCIYHICSGPLWK